MNNRKLSVLDQLITQIDHGLRTVLGDAPTPERVSPAFNVQDTELSSKDLIPINLWLGSNYLYMMNKSINPSLLDYFGPWAIYILVSECLAMGFFVVAYLPIFWTRKLRTKMATIDPIETRNVNRE